MPLLSLTILPSVSLSAPFPCSAWLQASEDSIGTLIVFGTTNHYIQRYPHLSTKHELEWGVPRGGMNTTAIGHHAEIKVLIPCSWIIFHSTF